MSSEPHQSMPTNPAMNTDESSPAIALRNPGIAALLAWVIPGAGHMYQGRWAKGLLFSFCILGTFFYGILLGGSRTVYASLRPYDMRYAFLFQVGAGAPTFPALIQAAVAGPDRAPLWDGFMAPPVLVGQEVPRAWAEEQMAIGFPNADFEKEDFIPSKSSANRMIYSCINQKGIVVTEPSDNELGRNQSSVWHSKYDFRYDLGTIFTMIAGLLNLLVVFDAAAGPALGYDSHDYERKLAASKAALEEEAALKKAAKAKKRAIA